ncbi:MAG: segregation/condensation protein A [bacterium]|nr:segregation/condensation protein A [bacterium]
MNFTAEQFSGPLDLLLEMIQEQKLDITEISLAQIADQYITYIENNKQIDPEEMANFLVIASRLLLIKSKTLLPYLIQDEEEDEIADFANQLKIYKDFLDASKVIKDMWAQRNYMRARESFNFGASEEKMFFPPPNVNLQILKHEFKVVIKRLRPEETLAEDSIVKSVSLDERISTLRSALDKLGVMSFNKFISTSEGKIDIIISFIAILELTKQKIVSCDQSKLFSDITINKI